MYISFKLLHAVLFQVSSFKFNVYNSVSSLTFVILPSPSKGRI
jgi:hypothetical protein